MSENNTMNAGTNARQNQFSDDEIDLGKLLSIILEGRVIIALTVALFAVGGLIYGQLATPIYTADALIQYEDKAPSLPGFDDMSEMFAAESSSSAEIEIIKSRLVIGAVVDELALTNTAEPTYFPIVGATIARRHLGRGLSGAGSGSAYAWGGEQVEVLEFDPGEFGTSAEFLLVAEGQEAFSLWVDGQRVIDGIVGEAATSRDQGVEIKLASLVANKGTEFEVNKLSRQSVILDIQKALRVSEKGKDTGIIVLSIEGPDRQRISNIIDSVSANYYFQNIQRMAAEAEKSLAFLNEQIPRVKYELLVAEEALHDYRLKRSSVDLSLETASALESLVQIEADISTMAISEAEISRSFTPRHPNYISFRRQQANLLSQKAKLIKKLESLPDTQQVVLRLMRDFEVNQAIYVALQNKRQELSVIKAGTVGSVRILDNAQVKPDAVSPKKALILVLASLLGGMLGLGFVLLRSAFKPGVTDPKVFEEIGLNVQAIIPLSDSERTHAEGVKKRKRSRLSVGQPAKLEKGFLLAESHSADLAVEALRSLRTSLHFAMLGASNNVVMISSANPGVGKSFITSNLSILIASLGDKRVLLVDTDMRKGYIHKRFGFEPKGGLSELLSGESKLADVSRPTSIQGLDMITRGAIPTNPSELLMGHLFGEFISQASSEYDLVILDTPPILAVTDPAVIGAYAATSLLVARFEVCSLKQVATAVQRFELNGVDVKGLIFNAVERKSGSYYYDYGYYNYEYKSDS
jgi:tyrosine-protein kinase Etk/Wzc